MQRIFLTTLLLFFTTISVCAQTNQDLKSPDSLMYVLEPTIVIADSKPSSFRHSNPIIVKTKLDFEKQGLKELYEVVKGFNGVQIKDYGGVGGVKTVSVRSMGAQHTAVSYDGVSISNTQSGQIDIGRFNLDNVSQVILSIGLPDNIFQPARNLASVGALTIKTAEPIFYDKPIKISASMGYSSFMTYNPAIHYEQKLGNNCALSFNTSWIKSDGTYPFILTNGNEVTKEFRKNSDINNIRSEINLYKNFLDGSKFSLKGSYSNSERGLPGPVIFYNTDARERLWDEDILVQLKYENNINEKLAFLSYLKYNNSYTKYQDINEVYVGGIQIDKYVQQEYYASLAVNYKPSNNLSFVIAEDFFINTMQASLPNFALPIRKTSLTSLSGQYKSDRLTITANLLTTVIKEDVKIGIAANDKFRVSPSVSLSLLPFEDYNLRLRLSYQDNYRTPTFNDLYYAKIGNTNLKPEIAKQFNLGVTYNKRELSSVVNNINLSLDTYFNKVKDKIVAIPTPFISKMLNFGNVDIFGVDATLNTLLKLQEDISLEITANYSYQNAVDVTDNNAKNYCHQIPYTPKHSGNLSFLLLNDWFNVNYYINAVSERYALPQNIDSNKINAYAEHNISLNRNFDIGKTKLRIQAECLNITNTQYEIIQYYPMPGRSYRISVKLIY